MTRPAACLLPIMIGLSFSPVVRAEGAPMLAKIECLDLRVAEVGPDEEALEITNDLLYAALKVAVTTDLPRMELATGCGNQLHLLAMVASADEGTSRRAGYAMSIRLELRRQASVQGTGSMGSVTVWDLGTLIMGRQGKAKETALEAISDLVSAFISDYRAAGNP